MLIILVGPAGDRGELIYLFAATAMTALVVISPILQSWLGTPLLVFLGKISFGIYLVHVPVLFSLGYPLYLFFVSVFREGPARLMTSITLLLVSSISGWVLWRLADRPAVAIASRLKLGDGLRR
jgi:peptidoglycan/LPS O-acetylase OafA/YrhL